MAAEGALVDSAITGGIAIAEANKAWRRQKKVLQNQIQWRVADLKAAGLNPILAAGSPLGGGAPSVSMARLPQNAASNFAKGIETKQKGARLGAEMDALGEQANASGAQAELSRTRASLEAEYTPQQAEAEIERNRATAAEARARSVYQEAQTAMVEAGMTEAKSRQAIFDNYWGRKAMQAGMLAGGVITPFAAGLGGGLVGGAINSMRKIKVPKWNPRAAQPRTGETIAPRGTMSVRPRLKNPNNKKRSKKRRDYMTPEEKWREDQLNDYRFRQGNPQR